MMKPLFIVLAVGCVGSFADAQGFLGNQFVNPALYNTVGGPVAGAVYNPNLAAGSGQMMMQACPYPVTETVDPYAKDELVQSAKREARNARKKISEYIKKQNRAQEDLDRAAKHLSQDIEGYGLTGKAFIEAAVTCSNISVGEMVSTAPDGDGKPSKAYVEWAKPIHTALPDTKKYAPCFYAWQAARSGASEFEPARMCSNTGFESGADADANDLKREDKTHHYAANVRVGDVSRLDKCVEDLKAGIAAKKAYDEATEARKTAEREADDKLDDYGRAKDDADSRRKDNDELGDDDDDAKSTGKRCAYCEAEQKLKSRALWIAGGAALISGVGSFLLGRQEINNCSRQGFVCSGFGPQNVMTSFASGLGAASPFLSYGLSPTFPPGAFRYPMMYQNIYGATPGGFNSGSFGCGPTMAMSPFAQQMGPFNGANPGYFPGAAYMPGMGPWGVPGPGQVMPGMPGAFPGMPGYNQMGFNPAMYQYMAQMNQQNQDLQRLGMAQMMAIGYGINSLNQEYQWANSLGGGMGAGGLNGGNWWGGGQNFGAFNGFNQGFSPLMAGSFSGGFMRNSCGNSFFGNSISICGSFPIGGNFAPTYSNGFNNGGAFGNQFNLNGGATFGR